MLLLTGCVWITDEDLAARLAPEDTGAPSDTGASVDTSDTSGDTSDSSNTEDSADTADSGDTGDSGDDTGDSEGDTGDSGEDTGDSGDSGEDTGDCDADGDGWEAVECGGLDCDDALADVNPDAEEVCNDLDDDCDALVDNRASDAFTVYYDGDADGYGDAAVTVEACGVGDGYVANDDDCDDSTASIHPAGTEVCNDLDDDCNGAIDDDAVGAITQYADDDGDTYGDASSALADCDLVAGYAENADDCDDTDAEVHPSATEVCNDLDDDCDGDIDSGSADADTWYKDADKDKYGDATASIEACDQPSGYVADNTDCNDASSSIKPGGTETCNDLDDDCDGSIDESATGMSTWYRDADSDTYGTSATSTTACDAPSGYVADKTDCDDTEAGTNPAALEVCDGVDQDCSGVEDEDAIDATTWYRDGDADGYGDATRTVEDCELPTSYVANDEDCDDADDEINPDADDVCDSLDNDCDGYTDGPLGVPWTYSSIQDAIDASKDGDTICVAAGTYVENVDFGSHSVTLEGAGSAVTTIDAKGSSRPLTIYDKGVSPTVTGFTLTGGESAYGGGLYIYGKDPVIEDVVVEGNSCTLSESCFGTGIYLVGQATLTDVVVQDNYAEPIGSSIGTDSSSYGVGICADAATGTFTRVTVSGNVADLSNAAAAGYANGVGMYLTSTTLTFEDLEITGNTGERTGSSGSGAVGQGAGLFGNSDSSTFADVSITANVFDFPGTADSGAGGGMYLDATTATFDHLLLADNAVSAGTVYGSAIYGYTLKALTVTNAIIAANIAQATSHATGALTFVGGVYTLTNVDVVGNDTASSGTAYGGAFYLSDAAALTLDSVSVAANTLDSPRTTTESGGAIYEAKGTVPSIANSNFYNNTATEFSGISSPVGSNGNIAVNPKYTNTTSAYGADWNLTLQASSGMKDKGNIKVTDVDGSTCDMGAYGGPGGDW